MILSRRILLRKKSQKLNPKINIYKGENKLFFEIQFLDLKQKKVIKKILFLLSMDGGKKVLNISHYYYRFDFRCATALEEAAQIAVCSNRRWR